LSNIENSFKLKLLRMAKHVFFITLLLTVSKFAVGQQMVVDDADITTYRSFQTEIWYGSIDSWVLPAASPFSFLETSIGVGFNSKESFAHNAWLFETKYAPEFFRVDEHAVSLVTGITTDPGLTFESFYMYAPYTREILGNTSLLHVNLGYELKNNDGLEHEIFYGIRSDIELSDRLYLLSEVFTSNLDPPAFQAGVRIILLDELLEADITWGRGMEEGVRAPGFNFGLTYTPSPMW